MESRRKSLRWAALWLLPSLIHSTLLAGVPVYNDLKYADILKQLRAAQQEIQKWSSTIGTVRAQIDKLNQVSNTIRDLKNVANAGVRGITGQIASAIGVTQILEPMREISEGARGLYLDGRSLMRDIQGLPEEAKRRIEEIGLSVKDTKEFLTSGVYFDTFHSMGGDEWKAVGSNPWKALKDGSFGRACVDSDVYLSAGTRAHAFAQYTAGMSDADKARMAGMMGPAYARVAAGLWFDDMQRRTKQVLDLRAIGNKLTAAVDATGNPQSAQAAQPPNEKSQVSEMATADGVKAFGAKVSAAAAQQQGDFADRWTRQATEATKAMRDVNEIEATEAEAENLAGGGRK